MGKDLILKLISKVDPKWIPAIIGGLSLIFTVIYLAYTKKRLEEERKELRVKLAIAHTKVSDMGIEASQEASMRIAKESAELKKDIESSEERIREMQLASKAARERLAQATSWEDLNL